MPYATAWRESRCRRRCGWGRRGTGSQAAPGAAGCPSTGCSDGSAVQKPENIVHFLKHLGEPIEPPPLAPARAPPYWQARELRHRPQAQTELFDA